MVKADDNYLILIIDKNPEILKQFSSFLCLKKFRVLAAINIKQALQMTFIKKPDLILVDLQMAGKNEMLFVELIKINPGTEKIPILYMANGIYHDDPEQWKDISDDDVVSKTVNQNELMVKVLNKIKTNKKYLVKSRK